MQRSHQSKFTKFVHPSFKRGGVSQLHLIKRKSAEANVNFRDNIAQLTAQVTDLKRQYDDLYRIQQQILYIFARYMAAYPLPPHADASLRLTGSQQLSAVMEERAGNKRPRLLEDGAGGGFGSTASTSAYGGSLTAPRIGVDAGCAAVIDVCA